MYHLAKAKIINCPQLKYPRSKKRFFPRHLIKWVDRHLKIIVRVAKIITRRVNQTALLDRIVQEV